ncbi:MAG: RsmB/NOP family class I SAM-dependent RNA methyltransferase [Nanoarchaeota archaeon]|nr:RsmB/NOP family class I SAM-dependent RNA methyltransferase [Nanoarchaeota archaeon]MBU4308211.1 RsmB/NOP family class I SAM-dependent RNA methyltransferase [Nanoarchaeota archaeon]
MKTKKIPEMKPAFLERMKLLLPDEKDLQSYLDILKVKPVKSFRCNTLKISPENLKKRLEAKRWKIFQPWENYPEVMIVEGKYVRSCAQIDKLATDSVKSLVEINNTTNKKSLKEELPFNKVLVKKSDSVDFEVNQLRAKGEQILQDLEPGEFGRSLEHLLGYYYIQELASMLPIVALKPNEDEIFLDLCAAPGSKTTQVVAEMKNTGNVFANEVSLGRLRILASNLERCGTTNTLITKKDGIILCKRFKELGIFPDKILVDAPCSGEGTLRSSYQTYLMWNEKTIKRLSKIQKKLVESAIEILKSGGEMIYSTCTHAPEENEEVVNWVLENFPEMKLENIELPIKTRPGLTKWQDKEFSSELKKCARVYPHDNDTEGFFVAKLKKCQ